MQQSASAPVVVENGDEERDVREVGVRHLEDVRLVEHGVQRSLPHLRLALLQAAAAKQEFKLHVRICARAETQTEQFKVRCGAIGRVNMRRVD